MPNVLLEALCAALDHFEAGFVAVFPDAMILHANRTAQEMMACCWPIQSNNGCLEACSKEATSLLLETLRRLAHAPHEPCPDICLADAASPRGPAIATMKRLAGAKLDPSPLAIFVTSLQNRSDFALSAVAQCFGLTPAESRTLHHFVEGATVAEAALALEISENTVKTHLQNIFTKTRASRQAQLIKLVSDLSPPLRFEGVGCSGG